MYESIPDKSEFVTAQRDEEDVTQRSASGQNTHRLQPANKAASLLARISPPPAAARCHENERCERRIGRCTVAVTLKAWVAVWPTSVTSVPARR